MKSETKKGRDEERGREERKNKKEGRERERGERPVEVDFLGSFGGEGGSSLFV